MGFIEYLCQQDSYWFFRYNWNCQCDNFDVSNHVGVTLKDGFPTRFSVDWIQSGSGLVTLRHEKSMSRLERFITKIFNAPKDILRPLDEMNSYLWNIMDGTRNLSEIFLEMDAKFHEKIAPVEERVTKSILNFMQLGFVVIIMDSDEIVWDIGPTTIIQ